MYVYCSTIHTSKDIEATQMPINDRLDKENVVHIHHGILCRIHTSSVESDRNVRRSCPLQGHGCGTKPSSSAN